MVQDRRKTKAQLVKELEALRQQVGELKVAEAEHRRVVEALRQKEATNRALLNAIPDLIFRISRKGIYLDFSPAKELAPFRHPGEFLGRNMSEILPAEVTQQALRSIERALQTKEVQSFEYQLTLKGETRDYEARVVVCGEDEVLSIVRDITAYKRAEEERQRLQEQLFQAQKLEAIGRMASGIAHDFNNILTVMLGMSSLVKNDLPPGNPAHSNIEEVLKAGRRAKELVRQLLTLSRPSQQERRPVQMQQVLTETLGFLRVSLPATIEVRLQIENTPATVLADPTQLQQVILNLCLNAKQAMEEQGGILTIGLASSRETSHPSQFLHPVRLGPHVKLTISDTGHGMTPEIAQRIFEPFFTTKPVEQGSGLGLAIVHAIVTSLGGAIEVNSQPGQGATFDIYLPLVEYVPASSVSISTL